MVVCPASWITYCIAMDNVKWCPTFLDSVAVPKRWAPIAQSRVAIS